MDENCSTEVQVSEVQQEINRLDSVVGGLSKIPGEEMEVRLASVLRSPQDAKGKSPCDREPLTSLANSIRNASENLEELEMELREILARLAI